MTDLFAVLGLPCRLFLAEAAIKESYLRQAALLHPDASSGDTARFQTLQEAFKVLGDPSARLRHLLELTFPGASAQPAPIQGDLFMQVGQVVQQATDFSRRWDATRTPLARALLAGEKVTLENNLRQVAQVVGQHRSALEAELAALDARWPQVSPEDVNRLASGFAFMARWHAQLAEWEFRLSQE